MTQSNVSEINLHTDPLARTIAAYDRISATYSEQWFQSNVVEDFMDKFCSELPKNPVLLDAGCGSGREIRSLLDFGADCVGIDLSYETIKSARKNVPDGYFRVMDIRALDYPDNLFDGAVCIAVVHHLYDPDLRKALREVARVTRKDGTIALTIRLGSGFKNDEHGRFLVLREKDTTESLLASLGFKLISSEVSGGDDERRWLQVILRNAPKPEQDLQANCAFCQGPMLLRENRSVNLPIAASVLWGDSDYYVTVDVSPLEYGHVLLCTIDHELSTLGTNQDLEALDWHKRELDRILKKAFNRRPIFLEHGTKPHDDDRDSCIEHAHIHAIPLKNELRSKLEGRIGLLTKFPSVASADRIVGGAEYISYENKRGQIFIKRERVEQLPSQFFRLVVADEMDAPTYHWVKTRDTKQSIDRFRVTLNALIEEMDKETASRDIISDIPHELRATFQSFNDNVEVGLISSKTAERVCEALEKICPTKDIEDIELQDIGEREIIDKILVPYFEESHRGTKHIGDDAAVIKWRNRQLLATTDHCPTPVFFELGVNSFLAYGWLSVAISISDIAAMGGTPHAVLLNTEMPENMKVKDYLSFVEGVHFAARSHGAQIVGGNIREADKFSAATTVLGAPTYDRPLLRDGAQPGEAIYVAGKMGLFWAGLFERHFKMVLPEENHLELASGLFYPEPKLHAAQALSALGVVGACMDASDGPTQALQSLAKANSCDFVVQLDTLSPNRSVELVAQQAELDPITLMFTWGNFELVFTAFEDELQSRFQHGLDTHNIHKIGVVKAGRGEAVLKVGRKRTLLPQLAQDRFVKGANRLSIAEYHSFLQSSAFR